MEKYWERETQKAEDDLSKFVLDFSNSLREKEGSDQLVLDTFFEDDDVDHDAVEDGALNSSLQFNERTLMTSLDVDASLTSSLHDPNEGNLAGSIQAMSLDQSDFSAAVAKISSNLNMSDQATGDSVNFDLQKSLVGIIETSTESVAFDELQSSAGMTGRRSSTD